MTVVTRDGQMKKTVLLAAGWIIILSLAAFLLPPLDSRADPVPLLARGFIIATIGLSAYTLVVTFGYFYRAWRRAGAVPNKVEYASWLGFQTVLFLVVLVWVLRVAVPAVVHRIGVLLRP